MSRKSHAGRRASPLGVFGELLFEDLHRAADAQQGLAQVFALGIQVVEHLLAGFELGLQLFQASLQLLSHADDRPPCPYVFPLTSLRYGQK